MEVAEKGDENKPAEQPVGKPTTGTDDQRPVGFRAENVELAVKVALLGLTVIKGLRALRTHLREKNNRKHKKKSTVSRAIVSVPVEPVAEAAVKKVKNGKKKPSKKESERGRHMMMDPEMLGEPSDEPIEMSHYDPKETDAWLQDQLRKNPIMTMYPAVALKAHRIVCGWQSRFQSKPWLRHFSRESLLKEICQCIPVLNAILESVKHIEVEEGVKLTVVDLCSGYGFLSMFLSEMLPPEKVRKIVLVDQFWPMYDQQIVLPFQMSVAHLQAPGWPIPLLGRQTELSNPIDQLVDKLEQKVIPRGAGPVLLVGVNLCCNLSTLAVQLFNHLPQVQQLLLKPCCLPGKEPTTTWTLGTHTFTSAELWSPVAVVPDATPLEVKTARYKRWTEHLLKGVDTAAGLKAMKRIYVPKGQFQSVYITAARLVVFSPPAVAPAPTPASVPASAPAPAP
eukprot:CAMPEP_0198198014 /NCGR_PEP_ID=MMETSP1445-20131203/1543_1 /TAXON_ID=36898 /ORGANISM="Pyramimonas sp., Strain CCMP2087" /LENGTH=450 /DNA_ID=CAMNT_0043867453 /DNA_START=72 /DNA_END=1420 /DNA_ORIENTATION=+